MLTLCTQVSVLSPMSNLIEIVDSLGDKLEKLLHKQAVLENKNRTLQQDLEARLENFTKLELKIQDVENQNQALRSANAILGSNDYKRETKLKINGLIREIDQCIVQLSE